MCIEKVFNHSFESVSAEFLLDTTSHVLCNLGPVNCGKTFVSLCKIWHTLGVIPPCDDGVRRVRGAVIRNTLASLKTSTIKSWEAIFPGDIFGYLRGDPPVYQYKDGLYELEVLFLGLDDEKHLAKLKSMELTIGYVNEAQYMKSLVLLHTIIERTSSRYPNESVGGGGFGHPFVILDCNPPPQTHWIYLLFEEQRRKNWRLFRQPAALVLSKDSRDIPESEYAIDLSGNKWINNKDAYYRKYNRASRAWLDLAEGAEESYIRINLCGEYGVMKTGGAVHPEYSDFSHYSNIPLEANPNLPIAMGFDFGNTPACAIIQRQTDGRLFVLDELPTKEDFLRPFLENSVIPLLDSKYPWWRSNHLSRHDPADLGARAHKETARDILKEFGIVSFPCESNSLTYRRDCLKKYLTKMIKGSSAFMLSSGCHVLREGLLGEFCCEVEPHTRMDKNPLLKQTPTKNYHSHICEALEYACSNFYRKESDTKKKKSEEFARNLMTYKPFLS